MSRTLALLAFVAAMAAVGFAVSALLVPPLPLSHEPSVEAWVVLLVALVVLSSPTWGIGVWVWTLVDVALTYKRPARRIERGLCPQCTYPASTRCPECGALCTLELTASRASGCLLYTSD